MTPLPVFPTPFTPTSRLSRLSLQRKRTLKSFPPKVKHVLLSHLHADHVGGLRDYAHAQCWTSAACKHEFATLPRWRGFSKGLLHDLMPDQWLDTCNTFESCNAVDHPQLGQGWDVFGDESIVMFSFPGHAAGQHGALIQTSNHGPVLLAADAIWNLKAITEGRTPHPIVRLFFDDWKAYHRTWTSCAPSMPRTQKCPSWEPIVPPHTGG